MFLCFPPLIFFYFPAWKLPDSPDRFMKYSIHLTNFILFNTFWCAQLSNKHMVISLFSTITAYLQETSLWNSQSSRLTWGVQQSLSVGFGSTDSSCSPLTSWMFIASHSSRGFNYPYYLCIFFIPYFFLQLNFPLMYLGTVWICMCESFRKFLYVKKQLL